MVEPTRRRNEFSAEIERTAEPKRRRNELNAEMAAARSPPLLCRKRDSQRRPPPPALPCSPPSVAEPPCEEGTGAGAGAGVWAPTSSRRNVGAA